MLRVKAIVAKLHRQSTDPELLKPNSNLNLKAKNDLAMANLLEMKKSHAPMKNNNTNREREGRDRWTTTPETAPIYSVQFPEQTSSPRSHQLSRADDDTTSKPLTRDTNKTVEEHRQRSSRGETRRVERKPPTPVRALTRRPDVGALSDLLFRSREKKICRVR